MFTIYRQSLQAIRQNFAIYLLFAAGLLVIDQMFTQKGSHFGVQLFLLVFLLAAFAFGLHRHFLFGEKLLPITGSRRQGTNRSEWKFMLLMISYLGLGIVGGFAAAFVLVPSIAENLNAWLGIYLLTFAIIYFLSLVLFGSAMPAFVAGDRFGFAVTLGRIRKSALPIMVGLLIGPIAMYAVLFAVSIALFGYMAIPSDVFDAQGLFSPVGAVFDVLLRLEGLFNTTLAVAVLCNAYRKSSDFLEVQPATAISAPTAR